MQLSYCKYFIFVDFGKFVKGGGLWDRGNISE